ncbi:unnamed protein product [Protopolystoma xenopodis]|uniref:Ubiquitin thioesterase OTU n=1 Tax=Protopolystoma xenopodis TaxID=117903 RepID=A0A448X1T3_9PLAT|nr:unnamed protein product [Protopolystoma xenopodis]
MFKVEDANVLEKEGASSGVTHGTGRVLRLRCKYKAGNILLQALTDLATLNELLSEISKSTGVDRRILSLFHGYPPKPIDLSSDKLELRLYQVTFNCIPILSGDTLVVDELSKSASPSLNAKQQPTQNSFESLTNRDDNLCHSGPTIDFEGFVRVVAPSDNSCLFTSVHFCLSNAQCGIKLPFNPTTSSYTIPSDPEATSQSRQLIAAIVTSQPDVYTHAMLGLSNDQYCKRIMRVR